MTNLSDMADLMWRAVAGLAGGIVYLILKKAPAAETGGRGVRHRRDQAIFMGDIVAIKLGLSPGASGLLAIKLCSGLIDGSLLDAGRTHAHIASIPRHRFPPDAYWPPAFLPPRGPGTVAMAQPILT